MIDSALMDGTLKVVDACGYGEDIQRLAGQGGGGVGNLDDLPGLVRCAGLLLLGP